ncbi:DivIVA domain-containing protein [Kitasatospora sp. LaBMicrA B282]|uniref:DivIVA domain-containing protein n=1 Tax=Kitasatospora sp. LaBMicrA B282 TaxID=3420949 RepID=UPI003D0BFCFD
MFWVIVVAMAVVVGGAALVALGGGGSMPEAVPDRIAAKLPQERPLNRQDVDELRLPMAVRGYRMDQVDDVLDRLGAELAYRDSRIAELEAAVAVGAGAEAAAGRAGGAPLPGLADYVAADEAPGGEQPAPTAADRPTAPDAPAPGDAPGRAEQE